MAELKTLYKNIAPWVPGVPEPLMDDTLRRAYADLVAATGASESTQCFYMQKGVCEYDISGLLGGKSIAAITKVFTRATSTCGTDCGEDRNIPYRKVGPGKIRLLEAPYKDDPTGLCVTYKENPDDSLCEIPDDMLARYRQTIVDGALSYLLSIHGFDWSNPTRAGYYSRRFDNKLAEIRGELLAGEESGPLQMDFSEAFV